MVRIWQDIKATEELLFASSFVDNLNFIVLISKIYYEIKLAITTSCSLHNDFISHKLIFYFKNFYLR